MQQSGVFKDTSQPVGKSLPVIDSSWQSRFSGFQAAQTANPFCNVSLQVCEPNDFQAQLEPGITDITIRAPPGSNTSIRLFQTAFSVRI